MIGGKGKKLTASMDLSAAQNLLSRFQEDENEESENKVTEKLE